MGRGCTARTGGARVPFLGGTNFAVNIESWRLAADGPVLRHTVDIQMRQEAFRDPDLALVFHGEGCDAMSLACSSQDCRLNTVN